jgi:hypothetical protein
MRLIRSSCFYVKCSFTVRSPPLFHCRLMYRITSGETSACFYSQRTQLSLRIFRLFSRFTISTTSQQHLRIRSVDLRIEEDGAESGVSVTSTQSAQRKVMVCIRSTSSLGPVLTSL